MKYKRCYLVNIKLQGKNRECLVGEKMKKMCKKLILISVFFNIFCILISGINNQVAYAEPNSTNETMSKEEIMNKYYELKKDNQELIEEYNKLSHEWSDEKIEIEKKKESVDNNVIKIITIGSASLIVLTGLFGISVIGIIKHINHMVKSTVESKVAEKTEEEFKCIKNLIESRREDKNLMTKKKILLLYSDEKKRNCIDYILNKFNISKCNSIDDEFDLNNYDIILFNNECCSKEKSEEYKEKIESIIEENNNKQNICYFYYSTNVRLKEGISSKLNYANSQMTLYLNLLNLLKFHEDVLLNNSKIN